MCDTALVSTKILSPEGEPVKEGDEIMVKVVSVHGDQAIIKYAPKEEGGEEGPTGGRRPATEIPTRNSRRWTRKECNYAYRNTSV